MTETLEPFINERIAAFEDLATKLGSERTTKAKRSESIGGFDIIISNPPWERVKLQKIELFALHRADIAQARGTLCVG